MITVCFQRSTILFVLLAKQHYDIIIDAEKLYQRINPPKLTPLFLWNFVNSGIKQSSCQCFRVAEWLNCQTTPSLSLLPTLNSPDIATYCLLCVPTSHSSLTPKSWNSGISRKYVAWVEISASLVVVSKDVVRNFL